MKIDPSTGALSTVGSFDLGYGNSLTVDPATHTLFAMEDVTGATSFDQYVASISESTGALTQSAAIPLAGYIRSLVFEPVVPLVTPESIKADVAAAQASGGISNAGVAKSLLSKLNAAADARSRGQCGTAANDYRAFINELNALSGKSIVASTAAQLISEAEFLIANCP